MTASRLCAVVAALGLSLIALAPAVLGQQRPIRIGALLSLTGALSDVAVVQANAMRMAVAVANRTSSSLKFVLLIGDDESKPEQAKKQAERLIEESKVDVILGPLFSSASAAVADVAGESKVSLITTGTFRRDPSAARAANPYVRHLGVNLDAVAQAAAELEKATESKIKIDGRNRCLMTYRFEEVRGDVSAKTQAAICPGIDIDRQRWDDFRSQYTREFNKEPAPHALTAYSAVEIAVEAAARAKGDRERIARALADGPPFPTILGNTRFPSNGTIQPTFHIVVGSNVAGREREAVLEVLRRLAKDDKDGCDKCKKTNECPQGKIAVAIKKEDCCKKTNECPQGFVFPH